jgi:hypothetical protein
MNWRGLALIHRSGISARLAGFHSFNARFSAREAGLAEIGLSTQMDCFHYDSDCLSYHHACRCRKYTEFPPLVLVYVSADYAVVDPPLHEAARREKENR